MLDYTTMRAEVLRVMNEHSCGWDDSGKCQCGASLPFFGHTHDRWAEHVTEEICQVLNELHVIDADDDGWEGE